MKMLSKRLLWWLLKKLESRSRNHKLLKLLFRQLLSKFEIQTATAGLAPLSPAARYMMAIESI